MDDNYDDSWELAKEERRGSGRKGVQTSKARQKWNCSSRNHGCHGYAGEKSRWKKKGFYQHKSKFLVDSGDFECILYDSSGKGKFAHQKIRDKRSAHY